MTPEPPNRPRRLTGPFGPAGEILPIGQRLEHLDLDQSLLDALERLCEGGFSQATVQDAPGRDSTGCVGVLTIFEVIKKLLREPRFRDKLQDLRVRNYMNMEPRYIAAEKWVDVDFDWQGDDFALVGSPTHLLGMLTPTDILSRLTDYVQGFMHLESIEHDTRALFSLLLPLPENSELVRTALTVPGKAIQREIDYEKFEFGHYSLVFGGDATFDRLKPACLWDRHIIVRRCDRVGQIRNRLLHFRDRANMQDVDELDQFAKHASKALDRAHTLAAR